MANSLIALGRVTPGTTYVVGTDIFGTAITPVYGVTSLRITVAISALAVMYLREGSVNMEMNDGVSLKPDRLYFFTLEARREDGFNFRFSASVTIRKLLVSQANTGVL